MMGAHRFIAIGDLDGDGEPFANEMLASLKIPSPFGTNNLLFKYKLSVFLCSIINLFKYNKKKLLFYNFFIIVRIEVMIYKIIFYKLIYFFQRAGTLQRSLAPVR